MLIRQKCHCYCMYIKCNDMQVESISMLRNEGRPKILAILNIFSVCPRQIKRETYKHLNVFKSLNIQSKPSILRLVFSDGRKSPIIASIPSRYHSSSHLFFSSVINVITSHENSTNYLIYMRPIIIYFYDM